MIIGGLLLILLAYLIDIAVLYTIGVVMVAIGLVLWILGAMGRAIGPRPHYY